MDSSAKSLFGREGHHPAVRMGTLHRNTVVPPRPHVRGSIGTANVSRAAGGKATINTLRTAQAKLQYGILPRRSFDARSLRRNQGTEVHHRQQRRLQQLAFDDVAFDPQQRLVRQHHLPFRYRINVSGKLQPLQVIQKRLFEQRLPVRPLQPAEVLHIVRAKLQAFHQVNRQRQTRRKRKISAKRRFTVEKMKNCFPLVQLLVVITGRHR